MNKLTVFFEGPFWVGVFERVEEERLEVCRVVFGQEPKDYEIYEFILKNYYNLQFSEPISIEGKVDSKINPKRMQRKIKKSLEGNGISTKSQEAMKLDYESNKAQRKVLSKERRQKQEEMNFQRKQEKKKQKKKGH